MANKCERWLRKQRVGEKAAQAGDLVEVGPFDVGRITAVLHLFYTRRGACEINQLLCRL